MIQFSQCLENMVAFWSSQISWPSFSIDLWHNNCIILDYRQFISEPRLHTHAHTHTPACCYNTKRVLAQLTHTVPPVVLLHHVFAVEHLVADLTGVKLLAVLLLVLGEVAVGREEARADVTLEGLVVWWGRKKQIRSTRGSCEWFHVWNVPIFTLSPHSDPESN